MTAASSISTGSSLVTKAGSPPTSVRRPTSSSSPARRRRWTPRDVSPATSLNSRPSSVSPPISAMVSANLAPFGVPGRGRRGARVAADEATDADENAASGIGGGHDEQHRLRPVDDSEKREAHADK